MHDGLQSSEISSAAMISARRYHNSAPIPELTMQNIELSSTVSWTEIYFQIGSIHDSLLPKHIEYDSLSMHRF